MLTDELRNRLRMHPSRPFTIHVSYGSPVHIHHLDYAWLLPSGGKLHVEDSHGKIRLIDTVQIANQLQRPTGSARLAAAINTGIPARGGTVIKSHPAGAR